MIQTERLQLIPLTPRKLALWTRDVPALERELSCTCRDDPLKDGFLDVAEAQLAIARADPQNYLWHSFWLLLRREDRVVVGSADFKAPPDAQAAVEIGYGLNADFEHHGYMTEAVRAMCGWALSQPGVARVSAETELDNAASQRILQRCGFAEIARDKTVWWRLEE